MPISRVFSALPEDPGEPTVGTDTGHCMLPGYRPTIRHAPAVASRVTAGA